MGKNVKRVVVALGGNAISREFEEGNIDSHLQHIGDLILSYNTAEDIDFDASIGGGGGEEGDGAGDEEEEEDE